MTSEQTGEFPLPCELSFGTNGSNTKETFLSFAIDFQIYILMHLDCLSDITA